MSDSGDLGTILRMWRARLNPQSAGLPVHSSRRTPGIRREELAVLANVSVDYIVRLEQGRSAAPSIQVCVALARALQLSDAEQEYLFRAAGHMVGNGRINRMIPSSIRRLVERTAERPVGVFDAMWNLLAWNSHWSALMGDPSAVPEPERNLLWLHFTEKSDCHFLGPDSAEELDASLVGDLRRIQSRYPADAHLARLIPKLESKSSQFRELWAKHEISDHGPTIRRIIHSEVGPLDLDCDILSTQRNDLRIMMFSAEPGSESESKLALLCAISNQPMGGYFSGVER